MIISTLLFVAAVVCGVVFFINLVMGGAGGAAEADASTTAMKYGIAALILLGFGFFSLT